MLKVWTGSCWSWLKIHTLGRDLPAGDLMGSPQLVRKGERWWLHTPLEKTFEAPAKVREQLTAAETRICAVDLNLDQHLAADVASRPPAAPAFLLPSLGMAQR